MAGLMACPSCGAEVAQGDLICFECGANLARLRHTPDAEEPEESVETAAPAVQQREDAEPPPNRRSAVPDICPHCGAEVTQPDAVVCLECLRPLITEAPEESIGARASDTNAVILTLLDDSSASVTISWGERMLLGRDPAVSPAAGILERFDNISRRHASIDVTEDGSISVTDEYSTNGTFVGEHAVPPGGRMSAFDGDTLRLASRCQLRIQLTE